MAETVLYIAGPMYGLPEKNYPAFMDAEGQLTAAGYYVISPLRADRYVLPGDPEPTREWWQRMTMKLLLQTEGLALLDGWKNSQGAKREVKVALWLAMPVRTVEEWLAEPTTTS